MNRTMIRDLAEERLYNALGYIAHFQEGDTLEDLRDVAITALEQWEEARVKSSVTEEKPIQNVSPAGKEGGGT